MSYAFLVFLVIFVAVLFLQRYSSRSQPTDYVAIEDFAKAQGMNIVSVTQDNNHWRYWSKGHLVSNLARMFVVVAQAPDGTRHEFHVAFDPWSGSKDMKVLQGLKVPGSN